MHFAPLPLTQSTRGQRGSGSGESRSNLFEAGNCAAAVGFVNGFLSPAGISRPAEFALGRKSARALFARSCFGLGELLPLAGETRLNDTATAAAAFRAALAAIRLSFVCISFARPLILNHGATRACRQRSSCTVFFLFHNV